MGGKNDAIFLFLLIFFVFSSANWLNVTASSSWMPPPLHRRKGGQKEDGVRLELGGGCADRQNRTSLMLSEAETLSLHMPKASLSTLAPYLALSLAPRHDIH